MSGIWVVTPVGAIRISTLVAFAATLAIVWWKRRSPVIAVCVAMGWVAAFEIVYQVVLTLEGRLDWMHTFDLAFTFSGWTVAALVCGVRPHPLLLALWAATFVGWVAYGFHPNHYGRPGPFSIGDEVFNVVTKDGLAAIFVAGVLAPYRLGFRQAAPPAQR